jgi:diketogulonate reductase-like aldo/keto reductase
MANTPITLNNGATIPLLAFGTGTAHYSRDAERLVTSAIKAGFTHLDGAQWYRNEESLGTGIAEAGKAREQLFVTTKLVKPPVGKTVRDTLVESLKKLRLEYVDLFLIHTPLQFNDEPGRLKAVWKEMEALKKEGLTRNIGVSNFRAAQLREILDGAEILPSINQVAFFASQSIPRYTLLTCIADRVPSICLQGGTTLSRAAETTWHRDCIVRRALPNLPRQGWAARPSIDVRRQEAF